VTQQQWGGQPQRPPAGYPGGTPSGWNSPGYGQSPYGRPAYSQPSWQPAYGQSPYGQQPPPGYPAPGGPYGRPPAPRRNPLARLLLGLVVLVVIALAGLVVANLLHGSSNAAYQNDNYQVPPPDKNPPPLPVPKTYGEAEQLITANKFYNQTVPVPVRCNNEPINVADADDAELESHFEGLMECLVRVWQPPVTDAGWIIVRPTVTIYGKEITTKCGKSSVNAFYCSADQQVYYSSLLADYVPIVKQDKWAADVVMAHEFGHALQARTSMLISAHALAQEESSKSAQNQMLRRLETQADCFSGMFIRSVSQSLGVKQSDVDGIEQTYVAVGDDTLTGEPDVDGNHGLAKSRRYWGVEGLGNSKVSACNTFTAPARLVR
jgi:uncharacterized protein